MAGFGDMVTPPFEEEDVVEGFLRLYLQPCLDNQYYCNFTFLTRGGACPEKAINIFFKVDAWMMLFTNNSMAPLGMAGAVNCSPQRAFTHQQLIFHVEREKEESNAPFF